MSEQIGPSSRDITFFYESPVKQLPKASISVCLRDECL